MNFKKYSLAYLILACVCNSFFIVVVISLPMSCLFFPPVFKFGHKEGKKKEGKEKTNISTQAHKLGGINGRKGQWRL